MKIHPLVVTHQTDRGPFFGPARYRAPDVVCNNCKGRTAIHILRGVTVAEVREKNISLKCYYCDCPVKI